MKYIKQINKFLWIIPVALIALVSISLVIFSKSYIGEKYTYQRKSIETTSAGDKSVVMLQTEYHLEDGILVASEYKNGALENSETYLYAISDGYLYVDFGTSTGYMLVGEIDAFSIKPVFEHNFNLINYECESSLKVKAVLLGVIVLNVLWLIADLIAAIIIDRREKILEEYLKESSTTQNTTANIKVQKERDSE